MMACRKFIESMERATARTMEGFDVYQTWNCEKCGSQQTMPDRNRFYERGICEECKHETNLALRGCGYVAVIGGTPEQTEMLRKIVDEVMREEKKE